MYNSDITDQVQVIANERFQDDRGVMGPIFREKDYVIKFVEDRVSYSFENVLRGLHGDRHTWKLVTCLQGWFELIVVDARKESETYGAWTRFNLVDNSPVSVLIPPRFLNGHLVKSERALLHYKWSEYYSGPQNQVTVRYDDKDLNINWHCEDYSKLLISARDAMGAKFKEINL